MIEKSRIERGADPTALAVRLSTILPALKRNVAPPPIRAGVTLRSNELPILGEGRGQPLAQNINGDRLGEEPVGAGVAGFSHHLDARVAG